jgi:hypothetical protein
VCFDDKHFNAGTYPIYWDGKDDQGNNVESPVNVGIVTHNIVSAWQGAHIGNSSNDQTGEKVHHLYRKIVAYILSAPKATISETSQKDYLVS